MPWSVSKSDQCPASKPWACINDESGEVEGCHATEEDAKAQQAALYAAGGDSKSVQRRSAAVSVHVRRLQSRVDRTTERVAAQLGIPVAQLSAVELPWYAIRTLDDDVPTIFIYDEIGGSLGVSAKKFLRDLEEIDAPKIRLRINSPGGSVFDALAMHSSLLHHPAHITGFVDGIAASAASVVLMACDEIVVMPGGQIMIHDASMMEDGNAREHEQAATFLDRQSQNLADIYALRGGTADEWRERMLAETWMFPREAVQIGLADKLADTRKPISDPELESRMSKRHSLTQHRYAGRENAPSPFETRAGGAKTRARVREERRDMSGIAEKRAAAERRAHAYATTFDKSMTRRGLHDGYTVRAADSMPGSVARMVPFSASKLSAQETVRNGTTYFEFTGQASVFDMPYPMWDEFGPYDEIVDSGAERKTLAADPDVAFLENHRGLTMARTRNGTLRLSSSDGLDVIALTNPKRDDIIRLKMAVDDGMITEMSFAFMIDEGWWTEDFSQFHIAQFDIDRGDVSAVNYGANPFTSIAARQRMLSADLDHMPLHLARAAMQRLQARVGEREPAQFVGPVESRELPTAPLATDARQTERKGRSLASVEALLTIWAEEDRNQQIEDNLNAT